MSSDLNTLESQLKAARLRNEILKEESAARALSLANSVVTEAAWGDLIDRRDAVYDNGWFDIFDNRISRPEDRANGRFRPFFDTEQDLDQIRGAARYLYSSNETGSNAVETLSAFVFGDGFSYSVVAKDEDELLRTFTEKLVDKILDRNEWRGDHEVERFAQGIVDGECAIGIEWRDLPFWRDIDAACITKPMDEVLLEEHFQLPPGLDWAFGVATLPRNHEMRFGAFVEWEGDGNDWDFFPESRLCHVRLNVPRGVKRGLSDFYAVQKRLEQLGKLLTNVTEGAAIQASIALILEAANGTSSETLEGIRTGRTTQATAPTADGRTEQLHLERMRPGKIIRAANSKYTTGPIGGSNASIFIEVLQAAYRALGSRWQMPEYMISGNASNANYSSTLVAGGPFDRATKRRQKKWAIAYKSLLEKSLALCIKNGMFREFGIATIKDLLARIEIKVDAPDPSVIELDKATARNKTLSDAGIMSDKTFAAREGLDFEKETKQGAQKAPVANPFGPPGMAPPSPVDGKKPAPFDNPQPPKDGANPDETGTPKPTEGQGDWQARAKQLAESLWGGYGAAIE